MRQYTIEITTTQACNFACDYCFEKDFIPEHTLIEDSLDEVCARIESFINTDWFKTRFDNVQLTFWGGEPTLRIDLIDKIVNKFLYDERINFYIYTNASRIKYLLPILKLVKPRFKVQVSYDGQPVHDMRRKTKAGKKTSNIVMEGVKLLKENDIPYSFKSTLKYEDFKYLPEILDDFKRLDKQYALTVDYHNIEFSKYKDEIESTLLKVAKREYDYFKEHKSFLTNIFSGEKRICNGDMFTIDTDGYIYLCHGAIYAERNREILKISNIFFNKFIQYIEESHDKMQLWKKEYGSPLECANCVALTCLKCNVKKYDESKKEDPIQCWFDYTCQTDLCNYYKLVGKIGRALFELLKEEK